MPERDGSFPDGLQAGLLIVALLLTEFVIGAALYDMQGWLRLSANQLDALVAVLANGVVFTAVMHHNKLGYATLFHDSQAAPVAMLLLLLPIAMLLPGLVMGVSALVDLVVQIVPLSQQEEAMFQRMAESSLAAVLVTCVLAPVLEEMLFRGIILRSFLRRYPRGMAIWGSAVLFGVAHLNLYQFFAALVLGWLAGWLYERSRSLIPCIALHASYNSVLTVLSWRGSDGDAGSATLPGTMAWMMALLLAAAGGMLLRRFLVAPKR